MKYRSEIDGLRTIAVLSVICYHAQIVVFGHDFFKGGFVGVDIFFVISGYLISRILLSELFEKGKISFLQFYERRARRILPILFTVFLVSFPLAYKYLLPNQFIEYAQSILSATFFGSNIFFYFTNTQYGAEDSLLQPFLHTWSLGVEEQFYILFPIVLLVAYKFAKNHLVTIIAVLILISIQYADWQSTKNTQLNFFMLTSRLWELGIGSLLAFYELKYGRVKHELLNQAMPLLGLAMIAHAIVFFNNQTPHPSLITLLPTLGTALIILYSAKQTDLVGKFLSWKPIVGVGLISYSMYLWHYPLFAFARMADTNGLHNDEKYLLIVLTIILSIISYFLIEKHFRNRLFLKGRQFSAVMFVLLIPIFGMNWKVVVTKGWLFQEPILSFDVMFDPKLKKDLDEWVWRSKNNFDIEKKINFNKKSDIKILVIGDSNSGDFINMLEKINAPSEIDIISIKNSSGCGALYKIPVEEYIEYKRNEDKDHVSCFDFNSKAFMNIAQISDVVIWAQSWKKWESKFFDRSLTNLNKDFGNKFYFGLNKFINPLKQIELFSLKNSANVYLPINKKKQEINDLIKANKEVNYFDYYEIVCNKDKCPKILNDKIIMYDNFHLTEDGAKLFAENFVKKGFFDKLIAK